MFVTVELISCLKACLRKHVCGKVFLLHAVLILMFKTLIHNKLMNGTVRGVCTQNYDHCKRHHLCMGLFLWFPESQSQLIASDRMILCSECFSFWVQGNPHSIQVRLVRILILGVEMLNVDASADFWFSEVMVQICGKTAAIQDTPGPAKSSAPENPKLCKINILQNLRLSKIHSSTKSTAAKS